MEGNSRGEDGEFPWHIGVFDAHCHPTDTMDLIKDIPQMKAKCLTVMATRAQDQELVIDVARDLGVRSSTFEQLQQSEDHKEKIVPSYGWHPWFSHQMFDEAQYGNVQTLDEDSKISHYQSVLTPKSEDRDFLLSLPDPRPFSIFLKQAKEHLTNTPLSLVGEVGLDRSFRIPEAWLPEHQERRDDSLTPGGREGRRLSPYRVSLSHQKNVLLAQLKLAGELNRAVSVHSVQAHGLVYEVLRETWKGHERQVLSKRERKKQRAIETDELDTSLQTEATQGPLPYPPRVCLHSYSGPVEAVKQYLDPAIPVDIFFSFSTAINFSSDDSSKTESTIKAVPDDKLLMESDLHTAGPRMDDHLENIARKICDLKQWTLEQGLQRLAENWKRFIFGT